MHFKSKKSLLAGAIVFFLFITSASVVYAERRTLSLSGAWQLGTGEQMPGSFNYEVPVPGLVDLANPLLSWKNEKYFWYKKTFTLDPRQKKSHAFIKIDQSQFGTEVYLNGQKLGSYIGCYTSHEYSADKAINYNGENMLLVRMGAKDTLSPDSAVGIDWERVSYIPGIWGDVSLTLTDEIRIENVQVIPQIDTATALMRVTLRNLDSAPQDGKAIIEVFEKKLEKKVGEISFDVHLGEMGEKIETREIKIEEMKLWSPDSPSLYVAKVKITQSGEVVDNLVTNFGMREFKIIDGDFYLNGQKIVLKGSNIAFHRFLSDPEREDLVWDEAWIKKVLIDIPKAHNFNFFRNHIGQMYNRWYDIADEYGMLLQNEWAFWSWPTGTKEQIRKEFTQWLKDNWNHPSIIIWDALNEPTYDKSDKLSLINFVKHDLVSEMKELDPTRPWEPTDFEEVHPYIYSAYSVLGGGPNWVVPLKPPGPLENIRNYKIPIAINEYIYFWLNKNAQPSGLTKDKVLRWLGKDSTAQERLDFQAFLGSELTELWRRVGVDEIAPFVYLSTDEGATSHWFMGDIKDLRPKPILAALKSAFSPFGVSIELWDRHFFVGEKRKINVYLFNDNASPQTGQLVCRIVDDKGSEISVVKDMKVETEAATTKIESIEWQLPKDGGTYYLEAKLMAQDKKTEIATSHKIAHVFEKIEAPKEISNLKIMVYDPDNEIKDCLTSKGLKISDFTSESLKQQDILIVGEGGLSDSNYKANIKGVTDFVKSGKTLLVIEPSYGIQGKQEIDVCEGISLTIEHIPWRGNESYVFWKDANFPLWKKIGKEHLKMFNGGWGGEIVSAYDVTPPLPFEIEANCGLGLTIPALMETYIGGGLIVISRIEVRGRLLNQEKSSSDLYSRRPDPVAQQYLFNLLSTYQPASQITKQILDGLKRKKFTVRKVEASSVEDINYPFNAIDGDKSTRWSSNFSDPQWIMFDLGEMKDIYGIKLYWETAYGKEYQIQISNDKKVWETVFYTKNSDGGEDFIRFDPSIKTRFIRMYGLKRATEWGYSLWEFEVFLNEKQLPAENPLRPDRISKPLKPVSIAASSTQSEEYIAQNAVDGNVQTRWSSQGNDKQWLVLDFGEPKEFGKVILNWEAAYGKAYHIQISNDNKNWKDIFVTDSGDGDIDEIVLKEPTKAHYLRFLGVTRGTEWGYSLWEFEVYSP